MNAVQHKYTVGDDVAFVARDRAIKRGTVVAVVATVNRDHPLGKVGYRLVTKGEQHPDQVSESHCADTLEAAWQIAEGAAE